jgi:hypothetical protein
VPRVLLPTMRNCRFEGSKEEGRRKRQEGRSFFLRSSPSPSPSTSSQDFSRKTLTLWKGFCYNNFPVLPM